MQHICRMIMRKINLLVFLSVILGCSCFSCRPKNKDKHTDTITSGVIGISVDESFEPIIQQEIDVFEGIYTLAGIVPFYQNEVEAVNLLLSDSVRLAITTRRLTDSEKDALASRKFFPKEIKIATDGIAVIINKANPDTLISVSDLKKIMTGEVTHWDQLYTHSKLGPLQLVFDHANSSTVRYAIDSICRGMPLSENLHAQKSNAAVIDYVSKTPHAMGIIGVNWIGNKQDSTRMSFSDRITVMSVSRDDTATLQNSYKPYQAYLALGQYPLSRDIYVLLTDPRSGLASGLASFLASDRGQRIILKSGLVPATQSVRIVNVREEF